MSSYSIRWWRAGDRDAFLALNRQVLDADRSSEWFDWKYADNPYVDHVPIVVAERDDELVGARAFFGLRMVVGDRRCTALQPCDTMVREDHRRNGLFTRMTERAIERYGASAPAFFFNFPNDQSLPANRDLGWRTVRDLGVHYRIEDPGRLAAVRTDDAALRLAGRVATPVIGAYNRLRDAHSSVSADVSIRREAGVPATELAARYRASVPEDIHALRDETFYRWRFGNPNREYATYLADGTAAVVVGVGGSGPVTLVEITDVLPLARDDGADEAAALLDRIVADHPAADLFAAPSRSLPPHTLRRFGFHSGERFPLSALGQSRTQVARGFDGPAVHGVDVTNPRNWALTFAELDSA